MPERSWLVLWDPSGQASTHSCRSLKFLEYSNVSEMELQQIQQRFLPSQPEPPAHPESASTNHTAAAVVERESAPLAMVQNVAIARNNAVEQPPPPAASASLQQRNDQSDGQPLQLNPLDERQEEDVEQAADPDGDESEELHFNGDNNVFVGLDNYQDGHNEHCQKWNQYTLEKAALLGATVTKGQGIRAITWKVRGDVTNDDIPAGINNEYREVGIHRFDFTANSTKSYEEAPERTNLMSLLIHLWPGDWHTQIQWLNDVIDKRNDENAAKIRRVGHNQRARLRARIRHISDNEFWIFWGIILAGHVHGRFGELWDNGQPEGQ